MIFVQKFRYQIFYIFNYPHLYIFILFYKLNVLPSVSVRFKRWWKSLTGKPCNYKAKTLIFLLCVSQSNLYSTTYNNKCNTSDLQVNPVQNSQTGTAEELRRTAETHCFCHKCINIFENQSQAYNIVTERKFQHSKVNQVITKCFSHQSLLLQCFPHSLELNVALLRKPQKMNMQI